MAIDRYPTTSTTGTARSGSPFVAQAIGSTSDAWGVVEIAGRDARKLLQGQLTRDLARTTPTQAPLAAWCNPKGRTIAVCRILQPDVEQIWLLLPYTQAETVANRLRFYVLRDDARVVASPQEWRCGAVDRDRAAQLAQQWNKPLPQAPDECIREGSIWLIALAGGGYELCGPADALAQFALPEDFRRARLAAGLPSVYPQTREEFLPQMLNLDLLGAISRGKGCYMGQEIVTRTQSLGTIKRRMLLLETTDAAAASIEPGGRLYADGVDAGQVAAAAAPLLLAVAPIDRFGAHWSLAPNGDGPLVRRPLPYPIPEETRGFADS